MSDVKSQTSSNNSILPLTQDDGSLAVDAEDKAEVFNKFFSSVFTDEDLAHIPAPDPLRLDSCLMNINFTEERIANVIKNSKSGS